VSQVTQFRIVDEEGRPHAGRYLHVLTGKVIRGEEDFSTYVVEDDGKVLDLDGNEPRLPRGSLKVLLNNSDELPQELYGSTPLTIIADQGADARIPNENLVLLSTPVLLTDEDGDPRTSGYVHLAPVVEGSRTFKHYAIDGTGHVADMKGNPVELELGPYSIVVTSKAIDDDSMSGYSHNETDIFLLAELALPDSLIDARDEDTSEEMDAIVLTTVQVMDQNGKAHEGKWLHLDTMGDDEVLFKHFQINEGGYVTSKERLHRVPTGIYNTCMTRSVESDELMENFIPFRVRVPENARLTIPETFIDNPMDTISPVKSNDVDFHTTEFHSDLPREETEGKELVPFKVKGAGGAVLSGSFFYMAQAGRKDREYRKYEVNDSGFITRDGKPQKVPQGDYLGIVSSSDVDDPLMDDYIPFRTRLVEASAVSVPHKSIDRTVPTLKDRYEADELRSMEKEMSEVREEIGALAKREAKNQRKKELHLTKVKVVDEDGHPHSNFIFHMVYTGMDGSGYRNYGIDLQGHITDDGKQTRVPVGSYNVYVTRAPVAPERIQEMIPLKVVIELDAEVVVARKLVDRFRKEEDMVTDIHSVLERAELREFTDSRIHSFWKEEGPKAEERALHAVALLRTDCTSQESRTTQLVQETFKERTTAFREEMAATMESRFAALKEEVPDLDAKLRAVVDQALEDNKVEMNSRVDSFWDELLEKIQDLREDMEEQFKGYQGGVVVPPGIAGASDGPGVDIDEIMDRVTGHIEKCCEEKGELVEARITETRAGAMAMIEERMNSFRERDIPRMMEPLVAAQVDDRVGKAVADLVPADDGKVDIESLLPAMVTSHIAEATPEIEDRILTRMKDERAKAQRFDLPVVIDVDLTDPDVDDDTVVVRSTDGEVERIVKVVDGTDNGDGTVKVTVPDIPQEKRYDVIWDFGADKVDGKSEIRIMANYSPKAGGW